MESFQIRAPDDPELDRLASRFRLHPAHVSRCRAGLETHTEPRPLGSGLLPCIEEAPGYLFIALALPNTNLSLFLGREFSITVGNLDQAPTQPGDLLRRLLETAAGSDLPRESLAATRDIAEYLQNVDSGIVRREMRPWFRDLRSRLQQKLDIADRQRESENAAHQAHAVRLAVSGNRWLKALTGLAILIAALLIAMLYRRGA